jgi:hypothetical protein
MKNKMAHSLTFLLMVLLVIFTVATSANEPDCVTIPGRLRYESQEGYFFIKIRTIDNPDEYNLPSSGFELRFDTTEPWQGRNAKQVFKNAPDADGKYEVSLYNLKNELLEKELFDEPGFDISTGNDLFTIRINEEIIRYENPYPETIELKPEGSNSEIYR